MKTKILVIALLVSASFAASPLHACQPRLLTNFAADLEDGEHVFVMKYHDKETFEYPVSGVYRKGSGKELIWEYHGFYDGFDLQNRISSTGRYFIQAEFRIREELLPSDFPLDQYVALSIYDRGNLIGEFTMDTFISRASLDEYIARMESSNQIFMCEPWSWGHMEYDKLLDQISVRSAAQRTVVIDVQTAQIEYIDEY